MRRYSIFESFDLLISTRYTHFNIASSEFIVQCFKDGNRVELDAEVHEIVREIEPSSGVVLATPKGVGYINIAEGGSIKAGDVVEYGDGYFAFVKRCTPSRLYIKGETEVSLDDMASVKKSSCSGDYATTAMALAVVGEYIIKIDAPAYGITTTNRVLIVDGRSESSSDYEISVSY
jgi:hypothetical protein